MFFELGRTGKNEWWMYLLGFVIVIIGYFSGQIPVGLALTLKIKNDPNLSMEDLESFAKDMDFAKFGIDSNLGFVLLLLMFIFAILALYFVVRVIHKKNFKDIITPKKINWGKIFFGFGIWFLMALAIESVSYTVNPEAYEYTLNMASFLPLLIISLIMLPIQTSFEELFFRGYLMQGLGWIASHKWFPLLATSIGFGLIHMTNPEVREFGMGIMMFYYVSAGLLLGIITIMDDSLELALGVHAATNIYGAVMVGYNGSAINTDTVFKTNDIDPIMMMGVFLISAVLFYIICSKKYNWRSITKIFEPINIKSNNDYA